MADIRIPRINYVCVVGTLTRDPELKSTPRGTQVCRMGIAVNRRFRTTSGDWQEEATFINVSAWGATAERCATYLKKGYHIFVEGRLRSHEWEDKTGQKRTSIEIVGYRIQFLTKSPTAPEIPEEIEEPVKEETVEETEF